MILVLIRRLLWAVPMFICVTFFIFVLFDLAPTDPATKLAGEFASPEQVEALREELGLHGSLIGRYADWLSGAVQGDLGVSFSTREGVSDLIRDRWVITATLTFFALLLSLLIAIPAGVLAAMHPRSVIDRLVTLGASLGVAIPSFWLGLMLVYVFAVRVRWLPVIGYEPLSAGLVEWLRHLVLPVVALSLLGIATIALQLKAAMLEVMGREYILAAEARGLPRRTIVLKHALKNAAVPVVTVLGFRVAALFGGAVVIETVFAIDGLGPLAVRSTLSGDLPVVVAITALTLLLVILVNTAVDMSYRYFDPRTRS